MRVFQMYTKTDCQYCKHAISLLRKEEERFVVTVMDFAPEVLDNIATRVGQNTVPIILLKEDFSDMTKEDTFIGGFQELEEFFDKENKARKAKEKYEKNKGE